MWNFAYAAVVCALSALPPAVTERTPSATIPVVTAPEVKTTPALELQRNQDIAFYPGYGNMDLEGKVWILHVNGSVYDPELDSTKRSLFILAMRAALSVEANTPQAVTLDLRMRPFLVDHKENVQITIQIGSTVARLGQSAADGSFASQVRLNVEKVPVLPGANASTMQWLTYEAVMPKADPRRFSGRVQLIGRAGWSVITDIDDTIKVTQVSNRKETLANTFLRDFKAVPGMADAYRQLADEGCAFHYVSGSPWPLCKSLTDFCAKERFPSGSFHLKNFRLTDPTALMNLFSQENFKPSAIEPILGSFPMRRFILIGDSGEKDPEIYGAIARKYGPQIALVLIRNAGNEKPFSDRMQKAFADVPRERWRLFSNADEITSLVGAVMHPPKNDAAAADAQSSVGDALRKPE
jgi:phosphatidate phosphatase APP1